MIKITPLRMILNEAKLDTIDKAARFFNYSTHTFAKILNENYKLKNRMKEYIAMKLSQRLNRDVTIKEVFSK